jgi:hypothetical protein
MTLPFLDPSLCACFFFFTRTAGDADPGAFVLGLAAALEIQPEPGEDGVMRAAVRLPDGIECELAESVVHDAHFVRLTLREPGSRPAEAWGALKTALEERIALGRGSAPGTSPWAGSLLYHAILPEGFSRTDLVPALTDPNGPALVEARLDRFETQPFGWFLPIRESEASFGADGSHWLRELVLLTPQARAGDVERYYLAPVGQGFTRIELYLQKAGYHARRQAAIRTALSRARAELQESMRISMRTTDFSQLHREQLELEAISRQLMRFQTQRAFAEVLLNSLKVNTRSFEEHLERVKLTSPSYNRERETLHRSIDQMETDLESARTVAESSYAFQELQRGVEASRFERASYLIGSTAGLLAGIAIFNSFLDIWSLAIEGSGLVLPPAWLRILLGLVAGASWPLAAFGIVERRWRTAFLWIAIGLGTIIAAVLSTIAVN